MPILGTFVVPHPPLIIPGVADEERAQIARTEDSYEKVGRRIAELKPEVILVISPHSIMYYDYIHISPGSEAEGNFAAYGAPKANYRVDYDSELVEEISKVVAEMNVSAGTLGEKNSALDHGTMIPMHFINKYYTDYKLVRIGIAGLPFKEHYAFGMCIKEAIERTGRKAVIVASGDLSHYLKDLGQYHFAPQGPEFDAKVTMDLAAADFKNFLYYDEEFCDAAGECGLRGFIIMAGALDRTAVKPEFLSYEGPFGVGYSVFCFEVLGEDDSRDFLEQYLDEENQRIAEKRMQEDEYVKLARRSIESFLLDKKRLERPEGLPEEMITNQAGVFVSLHKNGRLRGCIGTIEAGEDCIADEIIMNAIGAAFGDTRFDAVKENELEELEISVDVLSKPEEIEDASLLDPKRYGVIVSMGAAQGLLLPNLKGVETVDQQLTIALQKAGIPKRTEYGFHIKRFEVVRHE